MPAAASHATHHGGYLSASLSSLPYSPVAADELIVLRDTNKLAAQSTARGQRPPSNNNNNNWRRQQQSQQNPPEPKCRLTTLLAPLQDTTYQQRQSASSKLKHFAQLAPFQDDYLTKKRATRRLYQPVMVVHESNSDTSDLLLPLFACHEAHQDFQDYDEDSQAPRGEYSPAEELEYDSDSGPRQRSTLEDDDGLCAFSPLGSNQQQHFLTIEELRQARNSCWLCGCNWQQDHVSLDCPECGGYALSRPCPSCDGECREVWRRNINGTHDLHKASWTGQCGKSKRELAGAAGVPVQASGSKDGDKLQVVAASGGKKNNKLPQGGSSDCCSSPGSSESESECECARNSTATSASPAAPQTTPKMFVGLTRQQQQQQSSRQHFGRRSRS